ncbi:hypothetical protein [Streptomyces sp. NPDC088246]|uniref:hypothetical protein n=1 Tax=Streptomyces sp. NPDC088246 TaxID=3365842 RepID=UPI00380DD993
MDTGFEPLSEQAGRHSGLYLVLLGRERLVACDRLIWFSDEEGRADARGVVFEVDAFEREVPSVDLPSAGRGGSPQRCGVLVATVPPPVSRECRVGGGDGRARVKALSGLGRNIGTAVGAEIDHGV